MQHLHASTVVLGAGAMGSATAYHLAKRGEPVVLVEQFQVGHTRGSSHGAARIVRHSYADLRYATLMLDAFRAWKVLEADAGQNVYLRTGGVTFGPAHLDDVAEVASSLKSIGVAHRRMTGRSLRLAHPGFEAPDDFDAVFEPDAGMVFAARSVALQVDLARQFGGERTQVLEGCQVRRIDLEGEKPTLLGDDFQIVADRLIVTAGAWVGRLLPRLPYLLRPTRQQVLYLEPIDLAPFSVGRFPVFIFKGDGPLDEFYGMPGLPGLGVKVARHGGPEVDPELVDRAVGSDAIEAVRGFLRRHIPALSEAPVGQAEVCLYTMAPDNQFRIGFFNGRPDVIVASPCSGHGFKFSCLIGSVLADLATRGETEVAIDPWRF